MIFPLSFHLSPFLIYLPWDGSIYVMFKVSIIYYSGEYCYNPKTSPEIFVSFFLFLGEDSRSFYAELLFGKWALRSKCRRYFWQSLSLVMSVQVLRHFLQTKTCIRMTILGSPGSFHSPLFLICRLKMNMAVTSPVIMTTCVSCRSPFATTWEMMWFCSPRMEYIRIFHIAGHCRDSTPRWTLVQVGVRSNRKPG